MRSGQILQIQLIFGHLDVLEQSRADPKANTPVRAVVLLAKYS